MAITVTCLRCRRDLDEPGGLMFSPPLDNEWTVNKDHLCAMCYPIVRAMIEEGAGFIRACGTVHLGPCSAERSDWR